MQGDAPLLRPVGLLTGAAAEGAIEAGLARALAGGPLAFTMVERMEAGARRLVPMADVPRDWQPRLERLSRPRLAFAGLDLATPLIMGILNVTPDSFSDAGAYRGADAAIRQGQALLEAGADLIDIGGESTRPGAEPVAPEEQLRRIEPALRALANRGAILSIDTRHPQVMGAALEAGAGIVNDVSALSSPGAIAAVARAGAAAILVHMQGEPGNMQQDPRYADVTLEVLDFLQRRIAAALEGGIDAGCLAVDPGLGFGKRGSHNAQLLDELAALHGLGVPIVVGASRKGWIGAIEAAPPEGRLGGSLAAALAALDRGAQVLRVHDVVETAQARAAWRRLQGWGERR
jgi:dihydropteroate synthase